MLYTARSEPENAEHPLLLDNALPVTRVPNKQSEIFPIEIMQTITG
jgi:hypothetical protein